MIVQTKSDTIAYEQALINIVQTLPIERIRQIVDYARFVQTQTLDEFALLEDEDPEIARRLHVVLVDRYTGATLFDISNRQHAGLILAYHDKPSVENIDFAIVTAHGIVFEGTYNVPVSGSPAAPDQLAPPAMPGIRIVGFCREGGVNNGP
jgi:hypothetical protein